MQWEEIVGTKQVQILIVGSILSVWGLIHLQHGTDFLILDKWARLLPSLVWKELVVIVVVPHELLHVLLLLLSLHETHAPGIRKGVKFRDWVDRVHQAVERVLNGQSWLKSVRSERDYHEQKGNTDHSVAAPLATPPLECVLLYKMA